MQHPQSHGLHHNTLRSTNNLRACLPSTAPWPASPVSIPLRSDQLRRHHIPLHHATGGSTASQACGTRGRLALPPAESTTSRRWTDQRLGLCVPGQIHKRVSPSLSKGHVCPKSAVSTASWILFQKQPNLPAVGPTPTEVWVSPPAGSTPHRHRPAPRGASGSGGQVERERSLPVGSRRQLVSLVRAQTGCAAVFGSVCRTLGPSRPCLVLLGRVSGAVSQVRPDPSVPDHSAYSHTQPPHTPLIYIL